MKDAKKTPGKRRKTIQEDSSSSEEEEKPKKKAGPKPKAKANSTLQVPTDASGKTSPIERSVLDKAKHAGPIAYGSTATAGLVCAGVNLLRVWHAIAGSLDLRA